MSRGIVLIDPDTEQLARRLAEAVGINDLAAWRAEVAALPRRREGQAGWRERGTELGVCVAWWTDPLGRRHYRTAERFFGDNSPPFWVHPGHLVYVQKPGEPMRLLALCGCGLVAWLHGLNWMGNTCGPCHDRYADDGLDVQADDTPLPRLRLAQEGPVQALAVSPDGERVASSDATCVRVWDAVTGRERLAIQHNRGGVLDLSFSPDSALLAGRGLPVDHDRVVEVWSTETGERLHWWEPKSYVSGLGFAPTGRTLVVATAEEVIFYDLADDGGRVIRHMDSGGAGQLAFAAGGWPMVATPTQYGRNNHVLLWRQQDAAREAMPLGSHRADTVRLSPDGNHVVAAALGDDATMEQPDRDAIRTYDLRRGGVSSLLGVPGVHLAFAVYPGKPWLVVTAGAAGALSLWDLRADDPDWQSRRYLGGDWREHARPVLRLWNERDRIDHLAISADGRLLVSGGRDGVLRLWPLHDILAAVGV